MSSTEGSKSKASIPSFLSSSSASNISCAVEDSIILCLLSMVVWAILHSISASNIYLSNSKEDVNVAASSLIFLPSLPALKFTKTPFLHLSLIFC